MLKLLGALLVIAACGALGMKHVFKKRETITAIRQLRDTLWEIARSIGFQLEPLPDILRRLNRDMQPEQDSFLGLLAQKAEADSSRPFCQIWQDVLEVFAESKDLPHEIKSGLAQLGESLGKMDYETELQRLHSVTAFLDNQLTQTEEANGKTEKMVKSLGVILGIFIVILFL